MLPACQLVRVIITNQSNFESSTTIALYTEDISLASTTQNLKVSLWSNNSAKRDYVFSVTYAPDTKPMFVSTITTLVTNC